MGTKNSGGRPTRYSANHHPGWVLALARLGYTDAEISTALGVCEATLNNWKIKYPEFLESIKKGKEFPDDLVEQALFKKAIGYEHPEDKIFNNNGTEMIVPTIKHYPPDTAAAFIWLKNRRPEKWRDKQHIEHSGKVETITKIDMSNLTDKEVQTLEFLINKCAIITSAEE